MAATSPETTRNGRISHRPAPPVWCWPAALLFLVLAAVPTGALQDRGTQVLRGDSRLAQRVSLEARHQPLEAFLEALEDQVPVKLRADEGARDLRVTALLRDRPLREVLEGLSRALQLTWRREGPAEAPEYTLVETRADRTALEREQAREWEQFRKNFRFLIDTVARGTPPASDVFERVAQDRASFPPIRGNVALLGLLPDPMLDQALLGGRLVVPFDQMSPSLRQAFTQQHLQSAARRERVRQELGPDALGLDSGPPPPVEQLSLDVKVERRTGDGVRAMLSIRAAESEWKQSWGWGLTFDPTATFELEDLEAMHRNWGPRTPGSTADLRFAPNPAGERWDEALLRFARENEVSVLSEALDFTDYPSDRRARPLPDGSPPEAVLDRLCLDYDTTWNAESALLLFRSRDWYFQRERQIPVPAEQRWQQYARDPGWYPLAELAVMAQMSQGNEGRKWKLSRYAGDAASMTVLRNEQVLVLYGLLTPAQRTAAHGDGLSVNRFQVAQRPHLERALLLLRPDAQGLAQSLRTLRAQEADGDRPASLTFLFRDGSEIVVELPGPAKPVSDPVITPLQPLRPG